MQVVELELRSPNTPTRPKNDYQAISTFRSMGSSWDRERMPDCTGRTALITGANSGIGFKATKAFATKGATVIMACRSVERGTAAASKIADTGVELEQLDVRHCDLASLDSITSFVRTLRTDYSGLDILCNNAGVMAIPRQETEDGFEKQFGVNHLGHFALTGELMELLIKSQGESRVVTHSSQVHEWGEIHFGDLHLENSYGKWKAYAQSKLANVLFAYELQRRFETAGISETISVTCHPGYADTNLQARGPKATNSRVRLLIMKVLNAIVAQSAERGALPLLYAATASDVEGGEYYGPGGFMKIRGPPEEQSSAEVTYDEQRASELWNKSEELTGVE